jgi:hypothetical protein
VASPAEFVRSRLRRWAPTLRGCLPRSEYFLAGRTNIFLDTPFYRTASSTACIASSDLDTICVTGNGGAAKLLFMAPVGNDVIEDGICFERMRR